MINEELFRKKNTNFSLFTSAAFGQEKKDIWGETLFLSSFVLAFHNVQFLL